MDRGETKGVEILGVQIRRTALGREKRQVGH